MSTVISVENLGKKYTISHQQRGDTSSLREVITNGVANFGKKLLSPLRLRSGQAFTPSTTLRAGLHPVPMVAERSRSSEDFWALKGVSFEVKQGERIGIIGRNGAGKSTLLKILSRITEPTTGRVKIKGRVASLLEVGTGFHPELTGRENIYLNGAILGMGRQEISRKFDEIVAFAEIEKFLDTPVKRYSSGMYVRLAFAVAAHLEPEILIVDEVLAVGDAGFQKKCLGKMEEVGREGRTVLFVSHNMGAIASLCTSAMLLQGGGISVAGKVSKIVSAYSSDCESSADIELSRLNHAGPGRFVTLNRLELFNEQSLPTTTFPMGSSIVFQLTVDCREAMKEAEVGLKITTLLDQPLHYFVSTWEGLKLDLKAGLYRFRVTVPHIFLLPGKYLVGAWISRDGEWVDDHVPMATMIEIIGHDITGNMERLSIKNNFEKYSFSGSVSYLPCTWKQIPL